ncbi:MAG: hypothetical protein HQL56_09700 [Magnetococcales bacterium]|nr:hypothetical protein [Magnetococcales bacterium]
MHDPKKGGNGADSSPEAGGEQAPRGEENWTLLSNLSLTHSRNGHWEEAFQTLIRMAAREKDPRANQALAQAVWLGLKTEIPVADLTAVLFRILVRFGPSHEVSGSIVAMANLLSRHRTPNHPERALAMAHVQQMFEYLQVPDPTVDNAAFQSWIKERKLDDPDHFISVVMIVLERMAGNEWWIDRESVEEDLRQANEQRIPS